MFIKMRDNVWENHWIIFDSNDDHLFTVTSEADADSAIKCLNKENLIEDYSLEIGAALTLENLIESHRSLRKTNTKKQQEWQEHFKKGYAIGEAIGLDNVVNGQYIEVLKLKNMTIGDLAAFIGCE